MHRVAAVSALVLLAGCFSGGDDAPGCGDAKSAKFDTGTDSLTGATRASDGYYWMLEVSGACSLEHAKATASVTVAPQPPPGCPAPTDVTAKVTTSILYEPYEIPMHTSAAGDGTLHSGQTSVGLRQAFGEGEGRYQVEARVAMPLGNEQADRECLRQTVRSVVLSSTYHAYQPPETEEP